MTVVKKDLKQFQAEGKAANGTHDPEDGFDELEAAGGKVDFDHNAEESDEVEEQPKAPKSSPIEDLGEIGWSDKEGAFNILGVLMKYGEASGQTNVNGFVRIHAPVPPDADQVIDAIGPHAYTGRYAGRHLGDGVQLKKAVFTYDADGDRWVDIDVVIPETQRASLKNLVGLARSRGVFSFEPLQMSANLTAPPRAE